MNLSTLISMAQTALDLFGEHEEIVLSVEPQGQGQFRVGYGLYRHDGIQGHVTLVLDAAQEAMFVKR